MEFRVLGPLEVLYADGRLGLGGAQLRRLLAILLVERQRIVSTGRLVDALWGEEVADPTLGRLRSAVFRLRSALEEAEGTPEGGRRRVETHPGGYRLRIAPEELDAARFESALSEARDAPPDPTVEVLDAALALWRGRAFGDLSDQAYVREEAARLEELRLMAREERFQALLDAGRTGEAVGGLEVFVGRHPWRERARGQLMLARYRSGRQAEALAGYRSFRDRLAEELGLEPSASLRSLHQRLLRQDPGLDPPRRPAGDIRLGGLPVATGRIVGREEDAACLLRRLEEHRVVTVVGTGGVGKTRLARHVVGADASRAGIRWCDLASVADPGAVAHAVASSVGAPARPGTEALDAVVGRLADGGALVVMDNCEHVREAAARLVEAVVGRCPEVDILATSRERLGVAGEVLLPLEPLPEPPREAGPEALRDSPAVELFLDRARAVHPGLEGTGRQLRLIAELCRRLDGLPLAIELAAARLRSLSLEDLVDRLGQPFRLLTDPRSTRSRRHRTLRSVVDWSYRLLDEPPCHLFDRLSVFAGAFTLEDAESVCAGAPIGREAVMDLVDRLVGASLVTVDRGDGPARYRLLDTLREYGRERLEERGETRAVRSAHAHHHRRLAEAQEDRLLGPEEEPAVALLDRAEPELREAYRLARTTADTDLAVGLVAALYRYALWRLRDEILHWADETVALPGADRHPRFPRLCAMAGAWRGLTGDRAGSVRIARRGLDAVGPDDPRARYPLNLLMHVSLWEGRLEECLRQCDHAAALTSDPREFMAEEVRVEALAYAGRRGEACELAARLTASMDEVGNPTAMASARYAWGEALSETEPDAAIPQFERAIELAESVDNRLVAGVARTTLACLQARHGDPRVALRSFRGLIDELAPVGDWTHLWTGLRSLVPLLARLGADEDAARVLGAVCHAPGAAPAYGADADRLAAARTTLADRLGGETLERAAEAARSSTREELAERVRRSIDDALG